MKKVLNIVGCVVVLAVAAVVGQASGLFNVPGLDGAAQRVASLGAWASGGFKGSPGDTASHHPEAAAQEGKAAAQAKAELARLISESQRRAVAKYPDLTLVNTEMNSRFVFRYNYLVKENNPRLQQPNWPETLADECAAASQVRAKPGREKAPAKSPVVTSPKRMVASSVP